MHRREFITLLGGAAAAWPIASRAQEAKLPTIGFLGAGAASDSVWKDWIASFVQRLRELGWIEGRTVLIEYRWGEGRAERYADIADEFVRLKVDVIVTSGSAVVAVKRATSVIPIVFPTANEPVGSGLVASLARPGGNATGLSMQQTDLAGKRLELLREIVPGLRRLGVLINAGNPGAALDRDQVRAAASTLGLEVVIKDIQRAEEIAPAFDAFKGRTRGALRRRRRADGHQSHPHQHARAGRSTAVHVPQSSSRRSGRSGVLWAKLPRPLPASRRLC